MPIFSDAEMARRVADLRSRMVAAEIDAILATSHPASYYLSGAPIHPFGRPMVTVVLVDGEAATVTSVIEKEHVDLQTWIADRRHYWDYGLRPGAYDDPRPPTASLVELAVAVLSDRGLTAARVGFEEATLPVRSLDALRAALPRATFLPASGMLDRLRLVKSEEELAILRAADAIADVGQQRLIDELAPSRHAAELHAVARAAMVDALLERYPDVPFAVRVGVGLGSPAKSAGHSEWTTWGPEDVVRPGQVLETVVDAIVWGYTGNVERAVVVGEPSERVRHDYLVMVEANERAIEAIRPGIQLAEVDAVCKAVFSRHGFTTRTGSGVGRGIISYEGNHRELLMDVRGYADVVLEPGMAFSLEPDLQTEDGVYRHCNTIIVTRSGCEVDSRVDRGLIRV